MRSGGLVGQTEVVVYKGVVCVLRIGGGGVRW
jgi:hypothetical protein